MEEVANSETLGPIVATADPVEEHDAAHAALEAAIGRLEGRVKELEAAVHNLQSVRAEAETFPAGRKTVPAAHVTLLAKGATSQPGLPSVDDALRSLSVEQRIAVKSGLLRAGLLK